MELTFMQSLALGAGYIAVGMAAVGSTVGAGMAGSTAIAAWKKCYLQGKVAPFLLVAMVSAPLSQTIYAMLMMFLTKDDIVKNPQFAVAYVCIGLLGGLAQMASAIFQGKCGAGGCVALAETGKGFGNYMIVIGAVETCAIFAMVFSFMAMP